LRVCPYDELVEACKCIAPFAVDDARPVFDSASFDTMRAMLHAIEHVRAQAALLAGSMSNEITYRWSITDEQYQFEWDDAHKRLMTRLDEKRAALKARFRSIATTPLMVADAK
jgi:hypothetical protein